MERKEEHSIEERMLIAQHRFMKVHKHLAFSCLGKSEFIMLTLILEETENSGDIGGVYVSNIAKKLRITTPAVSKMLKGLEEKRYIMRKTDTKDRRNTIVSLTKEGQKARQTVFEEMNAFTKKSIERLGESEAEELIQLLELYTEIVREEGYEWKKKIKEERNEADI